MRVLAIRGRNLASLDGDFEVDLRGEVLGRTGLFAITGPTGSGKSTLLDALSVALFDRTPRLSGRGGVQVGAAGTEEGDRIRANDARNLLRRGRGTGFAQVDFVGSDGHTYRSTWTVRRARERSAGRLQNIELVLTRLGSEAPIGRTKTEVLEEIQRLVGLDFDQFRRSALLAQGDFAAFLHAAPDEQAALLERMTGTEIYARLSRAAFERARTEKRAIADLRKQLEVVEVLDAPARGELEEQVEAARRAAEEATRDRDAVRAQRDWLVETARAEHRVALAETEVQECQAAVAAVDVQRKELARLEAVRPLRPAFEGWRAALGRLEQTRELAETSRIKADAAARDASESQRVLAGATVALGVHLDELAAELVGLDARLSADPVAARVEPVWDDLRAELQALTGHDATVTGAQAEVVRLAQDVARAAEAVEAAEVIRDEAQTALETAESEATAAEEALTAFDRDALDDERRKAEGELRLLERRTELVRRGRAAADSIEAEETALGQAEQDATARRARLEELNELQPRLDAAHDQAVRSLRAAEATVDLKDRRADLVEGEPCPLCGATDHPYAHDAPVMRALDALRGSVREADTRRAVAIAERAELTAWLRAQESRARERREGLERMRAEHEKAAAAWRATFDGEAPDEPAEPTDGEREAVAERLERARLRLVELREAEATAVRERGLAAAARTAREAARTDLETATARRRSVERAHAQAGSELVQARSVRDAARDRVQRRLGELDWDAVAPAPLLGTWTTRIEQYRELRDAREDRRRRREALEPECRRASALVATDGVEPDWPADTPLSETAPEALVEQLGAAESAWRDATEHAGKAAAEAATRTKALDEVTAEVGAAASKFDRAVTAAGEDRDEVEALLRRPESDADELRKTLETVDQALRDARTALKEREDALADRAERRPATPELDDAPGWDQLDAVELVLATLEDRRGALASTHTTLAGRLQTDDAHRRQGEDLLAKVAQRDEAARVWLQLDELIGSSDGKRFRMFAQGLTLDVLLREANHQLRDLARRYRLERVPGEDLALQVVDADLGDEVRAISSLSGGESFLVSLALALGLASMTSGRTPVESLFIDEGFGTLDPESLDLALSALEALQADGRQVGVISHVQGLAEHIGVQVRVSPMGGGRSRVAVVGPGGASSS